MLSTAYKLQSNSVIQSGAYQVNYKWKLSTSVYNKQVWPPVLTTISFKSKNKLKFNVNLIYNACYAKVNSAYFQFRVTVCNHEDWMG